MYRFHTHKQRDDADLEEVAFSDSNHTYNRKKMEIRASPAKPPSSKSSALHTIYGEIIYI